MLTRLLVAALIGGLFIGVMLWAPTSVILLALSVMLAYVLFEWFCLCGLYLRWHYALLLLLAVEIIVFFAYFSFLIGSYTLIMSVVSVMVITQMVLSVMALWQYSTNRLKQTHTNYWRFSGILVLLINAFCMVFLLHIHPTFLLYSFMIVWLADSGAWVVGYFWGSRPFMQHISPKKTWEGFGGGYGITLLGAYVLLQIDWESLSVLRKISHLSFLSLVTSTFLATMVGDLLISAIKRVVGVKDTGTLLPGHGGLLDRLDGALLAVPTFCVMFLLIMG